MPFPDIDPIALQIGPLAIRWYALAYIAGILLGWWLALRLVARPGAPMARRHVDDFVTWATLGIILGGRLAYVVFYNPGYYLAHPLGAFQLWEGGMSFHGGVIGVFIAILLFCRLNKLDWMRVGDYICCVVPIGLFTGRLSNFINGELWGRVTDLPWGVVFPTGGPLPRHPSQLYEAVLEGPVLLAILLLLFFRTDARLKPGLLGGVFLLGYGVFRFAVEFVREPDAQLVGFAQSSSLHMGQWLSLPMVLAGAYFVATAGRRQRPA
jgi:phosphatidylglycerol:prolipoprotein diacylglycerol transferase